MFPGLPLELSPGSKTARDSHARRRQHPHAGPLKHNRGRSSTHEKGAEAVAGSPGETSAPWKTQRSKVTWLAAAIFLHRLAGHGWLGGGVVRGKLRSVGPQRHRLLEG